MSSATHVSIKYKTNPNILNKSFIIVLSDS